MALSQVEQIELFSPLSEGDVFEYGELFAFAPAEKLVWRCEEVVSDPTLGTRYTFHVFAFGVMLKSLTATVVEGKRMRWGKP